MNEQHDDRVAELFAQALDRPAAERAAFVEAACGGDDELCTELVSLLAAYDASDGWFESFAAHVGVPGHGAGVPADEPAPGDRIAQYEIVERIGAGGMGVVYRARDTRLERTVALKFLPRRHQVDADAATRLLREARAASVLEHPNVATVYEVGDDGEGSAFIAMAWCPGDTLRHVMSTRALEVREAASIAQQLAAALAAAHAAGVVHRDVKPGNIIVAADGTARLVDFGIARLAGEDVTVAGATVGTVAYMSPEQTRGAAPDVRTDIWSLGVVLYEALAGTRPFAGAEDAVVINAIRHDEPEPLRNDVPAALEMLVARCLSKDPHQRPDAAGVVEALRALDTGTTSAHDASRPRRFAPREGNAPRRRGMLRGRGRGAVALALVVLAAIGYWATARKPADTLDTQRVLVAPLENRTGDATLDPIGSMAADWLIQGLAQTGIVDVVPVTTALAASRFVRADAVPLEPARSLRALADETRAGIVIAGAYYHQRDSLFLSITATDLARGRVLPGLDPVGAPRADVSDAIDRLRHEALRTLAQHLNPRMQPQAMYMRAPPSFDAYRHFAEGLERFVGADWSGAIERLRIATDADSTFVAPQIYAAVAYANLNQHERADSILDRLRPLRPALANFEALAFDMLVAQTAGDLVAYYRAHQDAPRIAPNALAHYGLGLGALMVNRPAEAVAVFRSMDPERGELRGWFGYWSVRASAEHQLGRHRDELRSAHRAQALHPLEPYAVDLEAAALAALGRTRELRRLLDRELGGHPAPHALLRTVGLELLVHGDSAGGMALLRESLASALQRPVVSPADRWFVSRAHYLVGDYDQARAWLGPLIEQDPENMALHGAAGALAARAGDSVGASAADAWLAALDRPYMHGQNTYLRARIAALLGKHDEAVRLLRQAWREGHRAHTAAHADPDMGALRRHAGFRELLRPIG
jgi:tetratricopeptide (TPR) repeat protein